MPGEHEAVMCGLCDVLLVWKGDQPAHAKETDHEALPMPFDADKAHFKCDFCGDVYPDVQNAFTLPANDFPDPVIPNANSRGAWCACMPCAVHIGDGDWDKVFERAIAGLDPTPALRQEMGQWLKALHFRLRQNITGPLRPYKPGDETW